MKQTLIGTLVLFAVLGAVHLLLWPLNKDIHSAQLQQKKELRPLKILKIERKKLELRQRRELETYNWVDERKDYAEIPLERAFDYYLRSAKP